MKPCMNNILNKQENKISQYAVQFENRSSWHLFDKNVTIYTIIATLAEWLESLACSKYLSLMQLDTELKEH